MLDFQTYDARKGGNVLYKALAHPLTAEQLSALGGRLRRAGPLAIFDPAATAAMLLALHGDLPAPVSIFVQDVELVGQEVCGLVAEAITELSRCEAATLLVAAFDAGPIMARIQQLLPRYMQVISLDEVRLPKSMLTSQGSYLDRLNFATNYAFFRDAGGLSTRLVTANYWASYGARAVRLWLRLFDSGGQPIAAWEEDVPAGAGGITIDSRAVRQRFDLPEFVGQMFIHAIGVAGHDVVKYALDVLPTRDDDEEGASERSLSVTHDANAWPSDRYANLPAPRPDETVLLWVQNSHAVPIPPGALQLDRMGAESPVAIPLAIAPYASVALDVSTYLPGLGWPGQIEVRCGRHMVRPRYEIRRGARTRIAHLNVERADLRPDPHIPQLPRSLGRGYLLPFPILPPETFRSIVLPTPMGERQLDLPVRLDVFDRGGEKVAERFLGRLPRDHDLAVDLSEVGAPEGHAELVYDFRDGGSADGWLHALVRYEHRESMHVAETSFGAHIFNTAMTYRDEPQSYSGPPPGLSTRLFLRLGDRRRKSFAALMYPASATWHRRSRTLLMLHDGMGEVLAERLIEIACSGSMMVWPHLHFSDELLGQAGPRGYVLIRDTTCRLFGYHGLMDKDGAFSLDHMFGF